MKFHTTIASLALLSITGIQCANALTTTSAWAVTNAVSGDPHGLWTNGLVLGDTSTNTDEQLKRYSFNTGSLLEYANGTAHLTATASNPSGYTASIDVWFDGYSDTYSTIKTGGGSDTTDWNFYSTVTAGSKITLNSIDYYLGMVNNGTGPVLQIGTGANDKSSVFGASTWLDIYSDAGRSNKLFDTRHWDLNMNLENDPLSGGNSSVPIPAAAWLFGTGFMGLVGMAKRRKLNS